MVLFIPREFSKSDYFEQILLLVFSWSSSLFGLSLTPTLTDRFGRTVMLSLLLRVELLLYFPFLQLMYAFVYVSAARQDVKAGPILVNVVLLPSESSDENQVNF